MTDTLSQLSALAIYAAVGIYALAFIAFAVDLAGRGARATVAQSVTSAVEHRAAQQRAVQQQASGGGVATLTKLTARMEAEVFESRHASRSLKTAMLLTTIGFGFHLVADILRGFAAGRVPWSNMWEFSMTGTLIIIGVFLAVTLRFAIKFVGAFVTGLVFVLLMVAALRYYVPVAPLPPALQSYWLVIHVLVAILATGFFALGFALSGLQLLQGRREQLILAAKQAKLTFLATMPSAATLENLAYRLNIIGFILWSFTLIAGSIWADHAWGRYWGWDTKEVWTFIIWVLYAGYIHARATQGWRGSRAAWLAIIGFCAVMFNFGVVNVFFHGLHSYSGL